MKNMLLLDRIIESSLWLMRLFTLSIHFIQFSWTISIIIESICKPTKIGIWSPECDYKRLIIWYPGGRGVKSLPRLSLKNITKAKLAIIKLSQPIVLVIRMKTKYPNLMMVKKNPVSEPPEYQMVNHIHLNHRQALSNKIAWGINL